MDPLPPDPYVALGVPKDAPAATIKATYRKLVLKTHPDKFTDETIKQQKQEEFHKIQQAYEIIGDEDKRATYDAEVRLDFLRREKLARTGGSGPSTEAKAARYDVRTAEPAGASHRANTSYRYDERKPSSRAYDDDRYDERSRKYDVYEASPKHTSSSRTSRPEREPVKVARPSTDRTRSDRNKTRDREERRDRSGKFVSVEEETSSNDEKARYEASYRRRSDEEEARRAAADARRRAEDRRSYEEPKEPRQEPRRHRSDEDNFDRQRKLSDLEKDAFRYIQRSKVEDPRPSPSRTNSSRDVRPAEAYDSRSRRPETVRRSSARPKDARTSSPRRDRDRKIIPEIVEWEEDSRKPPSFKHSSSSPAEIHVPRSAPQRSYTETSHRRVDTSPTPLFRRSETMPSVPHSSSSRRKEATVTRPSGLRSSESASPHEAVYSTSPPESSYPTVPPPQSSASKKYYYPTPGGGVSLRPEDVGVANGHRAVLREPGSHRTRSPSPLSRPPMGPNRPSETSSSRYETVAPASSKRSVPMASGPPPPLGRSATMTMEPGRGEDRGRSGRLYGEIRPELRRENASRRQTSFTPEAVNYTKKYGPEDVRWSGGEDREYAPKPMLSRHSTSVY